MQLYINTTKGDDISICIKDGSKVIAQKKINAKYKQAEKLLLLIDKTLQQKKLKIQDIKIIKVANQDGSFTALRIGVVTANAMGYALGVPVKEVAKGCKKLKKVKRGYKKFDIIKPIYSKEPNITTTNKITNNI